MNRVPFPLLMPVAVAAALALAGCQSMVAAPAPTASTPATVSLYDRLGGMPAITAVVDDFVGNVAADQRINGRFANANVPRLKALLVEQICAGTGGPCKYTGRDMPAAHRGMNISDAEFGALVEDLVRSLDRFNVPSREKNDLLAALGPMKPAIVGQ